MSKEYKFLMPKLENEKNIDIFNSPLIVKFHNDKGELICKKEVKGLKLFKKFMLKSIWNIIKDKKIKL